RVDPDQAVDDHAEPGRQAARALQAGQRLDRELPHPLEDGRHQLPAGLAGPGVPALPGREPCLERGRQLTHRADLGPAPRPAAGPCPFLRMTMAVTIRPLAISQRPSNPVSTAPFTTGPSTSSRAVNVWLA